MKQIGLIYGSETGVTEEITGSIIETWNFGFPMKICPGKRSETPSFIAS